MTTMIQRCEGIAVAATTNACVVDGAVERVVFRGAAASEVLPRALRVLSRPLRVDELGDVLGISEAQALQLVQVLDERCLVERVAWGVEPTTRFDPPIRAFFSRSLGNVRAFRSCAELAGHLQRVSMWVVSPDDVDAEVLDLFGGVGIDVRRLSVAALLESEATPSLVWVVSVDGEGPMSSVAAWCASTGVTALRTRIDSSRPTVEIGPLFDRHAVCHRCFLGGRAPDHVVGGTEVERAHAIATGLPLAAGEVINLLTSAGIPRVGPMWLRVDLEQWTTDEEVATAHVGCAACFGGLVGHEPDRTVAAYEQLAELSAFHLANTSLRSFATGEARPGREDLEQLGPSLVDVVDRDRRDLVERLNDALRRTIGFRDRAAGTRWAPSGGNLGSPRAWGFFLDGSDVATFAFDAVRDEAVVHRRERHARSDLTELLGSPPPHAFAAVVLGFDGSQLQHRYPPWFRLGHADVGVALGQLVDASAARGLSASLAERWSEPALEQLLPIRGQTIPGVVVWLAM